MTIEELKRAAKALPTPELSQFADWVLELREKRFDARTEARNGEGKGESQELEPLPVPRSSVPSLTKDDLYREGESNGMSENAPADAEAFEADMASLAQGTEGLEPFRGTYSRDDIYFDHD